MIISFKHLSISCIALLVLGGITTQVSAQPLFSDNFEDRVRDQALIGNNWTWFNQTFAGNTCEGESESGFGPADDGDSSDYQQENRNYWTASADVGQNDSYFRAGLEVPAWPNDEGNPVVLNNMLRVYHDQFYNPGYRRCKRTLIFQEMEIQEAGAFKFSFDVAQDRTDAPANGEVTAAFVKVLLQSNFSYDELIFEQLITMPPVATTPEDVTTAAQEIQFTIPEEYIGELLQFGFYNDHSYKLDQGWATAAALYDNVLLESIEGGPVPIGPAHSGSWYNESQDGHGFSIEFGQQADGTPLAVIYWYTYDSLGNPIFMVGAGVPDGQRVEIPFTSPIGMIYGEFDPDTVERPSGGTAVFIFTDSKNATFSYMPSAFSTSEWGHMSAIDNLALTQLFQVPADENFSMPQ